MLRQEEADQRLKQWRIVDWENKRLKELGKLPAALREVGTGLFGRTPDGKQVSNWQKRSKLQEESYSRLGRLSVKDRGKIFAVLFPKLADHLEATWQLSARLPYEVDYERKGFRAPDDPVMAGKARQAWLSSLISEMAGFDQDASWLAAWAPYLVDYNDADAAGLVLAAVIDRGGEEGERVFRILRESATNGHEVGRMGRHVTRALLVASRPDGWEFVEKLLLAAQRQEGLRQVILESIDEAHPEAFRRMLRLILDQNLVRFSSVVRAFDVWFGLQWDALTPGRIRKSLDDVRRFLEDPGAREEALESAKGEMLYLALWTFGFENASTAIEPAERLLRSDSVEKRFVAVKFLCDLDTPAANRAIIPLLDDPDLRVALQVAEKVQSVEDPQGDLFEPLRRLADRMPEKPESLGVLVWPWMRQLADRAEVVDSLVEHLGKRPVTVLLPYLRGMSEMGKVRMIELLTKKGTYDAPTRDTLFGLVGDRNNWVRASALNAVKNCAVTPAEAAQLEALLTRKDPELRQGVLELLGKQPVNDALASAGRLLESGKAEQRLGGLELLRYLVEKKKGVDRARQRAAQYRDGRKKLSEQEQKHLDAVLDAERVVPKLDDALGLMNPAEKSQPPAPKNRKFAFTSRAARGILQALDSLVDEHGETTVTFETFEGPKEELLGNAEWEFPSPNPQVPIEKDLARLPLREVWLNWWRNRPAKLRDRDGLEVHRARVLSNFDEDDLEELKDIAKRYPQYRELVQATVGGVEPVDIRHAQIVRALLDWLARVDPPAGALDSLLDAVETIYALLPPPEPGRKHDDDDDDLDWELELLLDKWTNQVKEAWNAAGDTPPATKVSYWRLEQWRHLRGAPLDGDRPSIDLLLAAFDAGAATRADLVDHLLGPRGAGTWGSENFDSLARFTGRTGHPLLKDRPELNELVERCRERVLEVELARGDMPTAATPAAQGLTAVFGIPLLLRLLQLLGNKGLDRRGYGDGRSIILSNLVRRCFPREEDTPDAFVAAARDAVKGGQIPQERLLHLAFWAPQWLPHVEHYFAWDGFAEGVRWFLAHTPGGHQGIVEGDADEDDDFDFDDEDGLPTGRKPGAWRRFILERTTVSDADRRDGVVDPAWFRRVFEQVGPRHWQELSEASKYGCNDNAYKKAQLIADVLRGKARRNKLIAGIRQRQLKENVRLLGLLPLAGGAKREADLQQRFKVFMDYRRHVRSLSPLTREEAQRALDIGLKNLAMTAGYPDPIRLEWEMEAREIADLARGPVTARVQDVTVTLSLGEQGEPELTIQRGDKPLRSLPGPMKNNARFRVLRERRAELKRQASRVRQSLEGMMIRSDTFTGVELQKLFEHPVIATLLGRLVVLGEGIRGYPVKGGKGLEGINGKTEPVKKNEVLRLAHPHDFLEAGDWHDWQAHLFRTERIQPFKQVFRELYTLTAQEKKDGTASHRYAGQQVQPSQAMALFGSRGWSTRDGVTKTFFDAGLVASVSFDSGVTTPLEVEGLTLSRVEFTRRDWKPVPLKEVPPRLFSEVMRDLDLVVSVAHVGGVDPEASASTVEMRAALLRETCALLNITNYRLKPNHVLIDGRLGKYSVHLGSGTVHKLPGGHVCIVPVHSQHRGRLFLPFADDDPRTAEVLSKVLLLARDHEIQDPNILDQLR